MRQGSLMLSANTLKSSARWRCRPTESSPSGMTMPRCCFLVAWLACSQRWYSSLVGALPPSALQTTSAIALREAVTDYQQGIILVSM